MKSTEFYKAFNEFSEPIISRGLIKKTNRVYQNDRVRLQINLDRHGWDDEYGWGFQIWLYDIEGVDIEKFEQPKRVGVIRIPSLITAKYITDDEVMSIYSSLVSKHPKLMGQVNMGWLAFYDVSDLRTLLQKMMPIILRFIDDWMGATRT